MTHACCRHWLKLSVVCRFIGYVDLLAFVALTLGALLGIRLATPWIGRIPDRFHAWAYIGLLVIVMLGISVR